MSAENAANGRLKLGVREAIHANGGIEGAAATVEKSPSLAGLWNNVNKSDLPSLADARLLDEGAMAAGRRPAILTRYAAELGHVAIRLPDAESGGAQITDALVEVSAEFGDVANSVRDATMDGVIEKHERQRIMDAIDDAQGALARMRALVAQDNGNPTLAAIRRAGGQ